MPVCLSRMARHSRKSYSDRQLRPVASVSFKASPRLPVRSSIAASIGLPPYIGCATEKLQPDRVIVTHGRAPATKHGKRFCWQSGNIDRHLSPANRQSQPASTFLSHVGCLSYPFPSQQWFLPPVCRRSVTRQEESRNKCTAHRYGSVLIDTTTLLCGY